jgi:cyanate lyase
MSTDPMKRLQAMKDRLKTWRAVADELGYSQPYLCDVLYGRRAVTDKMLGKLGLAAKRVVVRAK